MSLFWECGTFLFSSFFNTSVSQQLSVYVRTAWNNVNASVLVCFWSSFPEQPLELWHQRRLKVQEQMFPQPLSVGRVKLLWICCGWSGSCDDRCTKLTSTTQSCTNQAAGSGVNPQSAKERDDLWLGCMVSQHASPLLDLTSGYFSCFLVGFSFSAESKESLFSVFRFLLLI